MPGRYPEIYGTQASYHLFEWQYAHPRRMQGKVGEDLASSVPKQLIEPPQTDNLRNRHPLLWYEIGMHLLRSGNFGTCGKESTPSPWATNSMAPPQHPRQCHLRPPDPPTNLKVASPYDCPCGISVAKALPP